MRNELLELMKDKLPSLARSVYDQDKYAHFIYDDDQVNIDYDNDTGVIVYEFAVRYIQDSRYNTEYLKSKDIEAMCKKLQRVHMKFTISYHNFLLSLLEEANI